MTPLPQPKELDQFREVVARRLGLQFDENKLAFLGDIVNRRMEEKAWTDVGRYVRLIESREGTIELRALADLLTVCETFFFRYADHFRVLSEKIIPDRMMAPGGKRQIRLLSAGCASGEEPYSLSILIRERLAAEIDSWDVRIHAFDISPLALRKARRACYSPWSLRDTPPDILRRYFRGDHGESSVDPCVRGMVTFEERNLTEDDQIFWRPGSFDVVFCRNVMMYFVPDAARAVVARIARSLVPGGYLFLGHAETLRGVSHDFHLRHTHDTFYYQRRDGAETRSLPAESDLFMPQSTQVSAVPNCLEFDTPWVDTIRRASERIAELAARSRDSDSPALDRVSSLRTSVPSDREHPADLSRAIGLLRDERFIDAMDCLRSLPANVAGNADARLLSAVLFTNAGKPKEAEEVCKGLLLHDELNAGAHYLMALCREHEHDLIGALSHDQTAIYLDATLSMPHFHWGFVAKRVGDVATARRELRIAAELLEREDPARILLFGGGFSRGVLVELCRSALQACGEPQ